MKRSEINRIIRDSMNFIGERNFPMPVWAHWSLQDWRATTADISEISDCGLGWDITDMGSDRFEEIGLTLFTMRNGTPGKTLKQYCEKIMVVRESQVTPLHTHNLKTEDIINRGGGNLVIELSQTDGSGGLSDQPVEIRIDALPQTVPAGGKVILGPGQSVCLVPGVYHKFYGEPGSGTTLVGEVSSVNDDKTDNVFYEGLGRFPDIEEDEEPQYLLVGDYTRFL